ncbi:hypothetical protein FRC06_006829, partial [Ceratobasidium sp. 370]
MPILRRKFYSPRPWATPMELDRTSSEEASASESDVATHTGGQTQGHESDQGGGAGDGSDDGNGGDGGDGGGSGTEGKDGDEDEGEGEDREMSEIDSEARTESARDTDEDSYVDEDEDNQSVRNEDIDMDIGVDLPDFQHAPPPDVPMDDPDDIQLEEVVDAYGNSVYIEHYPRPTVGEPIRMEPVGDPTRRGYPDVGQLSNPDAFEMGRLLMRSGISARSRNCYLRLKRLRGMVPWKNNRELLKDVDKLPHGPDWSVQAMEIEGSKGKEVVEFWGRNAMDAVKGMLGNKQLGPHIAWKPVRKWKTRERNERIRDEANTANFMWRTQDKIEDPEATVVGCIVSSDETKLTSFSGDKKAHPVYISLTNTAKAVRRRISKRANILIGYLPVPKLDCEPDKERRRKLRRQLFHQCMEQLLKPLADACKKGEEVSCWDRGVRRIYPVLASYVADFPEQCKVACTKTTYCPLCTVKPNKRGDLGNAPLRTHDEVIDAMKENEATGSAKFNRLGLWDVPPFWEEHPYVD